MFDISLVEMLMVFVVALLVIGPERLPSVARRLGAYFAKARRFVAGVRSDIERELHADELQKVLKDQSKEIDEIKGVFDETRKEISAPLDESAKQLKNEVDDIMESTKSVLPASDSTSVKE